jgi:hypothetical protein
MVGVEVSREALKEWPALGAPMQDKTAETPVLMEAAGANMTPCVDGGCANEVDTLPEDVPDGAILICGSRGDLASAHPGGPFQTT